MGSNNYARIFLLLGKISCNRIGSQIAKHGCNRHAMSLMVRGFTGGIEAGDRSAIRIQHAAVRIDVDAAIGGLVRGTDQHTVERRSIDLREERILTAEVWILTGIDSSAIPLDGCREVLCIDTELLSQRFQAVRFGEVCRAVLRRVPP